MLIYIYCLHHSRDVWNYCKPNTSYSCCFTLKARNCQKRDGCYCEEATGKATNSSQRLVLKKRDYKTGHHQLVHVMTADQFKTSQGTFDFHYLMIFWRWRQHHIWTPTWFMLNYLHLWVKQGFPSVHDSYSIAGLLVSLVCAKEKLNWGLLSEKNQTMIACRNTELIRYERKKDVGNWIRSKTKRHQKEIRQTDRLSGWIGGSVLWLCFHVLLVPRGGEKKNLCAVVFYFKHVQKQ